MCRHIYYWNIVDCDVKQQIHLTIHKYANDVMFCVRDLNLYVYCAFGLIESAMYQWIIFYNVMPNFIG